MAKTGKRLKKAYEGIVPDAAALAKGLGAGMAIGALVRFITLVVHLAEGKY